MPERVNTFRPRGAPSLERLAEERRADKRFYDSWAWRKLRAAFLSRNPLCRDCKRLGRVVAAAHVHHVLPRKAHPRRAMDWDNLESLCIKCHNAKKVR